MTAAQIPQKTPLLTSSQEGPGQEAGWAFACVRSKRTWEQQQRWLCSAVLVVLVLLMLALQSLLVLLVLLLLLRVMMLLLPVHVMLVLFLRSKCAQNGPWQGPLGGS